MQSASTLFSYTSPTAKNGCRSATWHPVSNNTDHHLRIQLLCKYARIHIGGIDKLYCYDCGKIGIAFGWQEAKNKFGNINFDGSVLSIGNSYSIEKEKYENHRWKFIVIWVPILVIFSYKTAFSEFFWLKMKRFLQFYFLAKFIIPKIKNCFKMVRKHKIASRHFYFKQKILLKHQKSYWVAVLQKQFTYLKVWKFYGW